MSDPDFIRAMREDAKPVRQTSIVDIVLGAVALVAVAAAGYFGVSWWSTQNATPSALVPPPSTVVAASLAPVEPWTERDTERCEDAGRAAARAKDTGDAMLAYASVTEGFANMATVIACKITTKAGRFCESGEKAALVALINDYVGRVGLIVAALNVEGAPMHMLSGLGGEVKAGAEIHDMVRDDTIAVMLIYHQPIADGLKALARDGVISAGDFGVFMGVGVPPMIKDMLEGVEATGNRCG